MDIGTQLILETFHRQEEYYWKEYFEYLSNRDFRTNSQLFIINMNSH